MEKKHSKTEQSIQELRGNITWSNILMYHIIGIPEKKDRKNGQKKYWKAHD